MRGLVLRSTGSWYTLKGSDGLIYECNLRGKIKLQGNKVTNPIAVGDYVNFTVEKMSKGIIIDIEPRENYIIRKSTRKTAHGHILASNIDQCVLLVSLVFPRTSIGFIDRFLVAAESFRIPARIIFNKSDLYDSRLMEVYHHLAELYNGLGYDSLLISATNDPGFERVRQMFEGNKTLISGHSGVGKSTLLNKLMPGLELSTGEVSTFANKGIHTTTFATMYEMNNDTYVIDTPGIKELGLIDMEAWEISHYFPEMRNKFGDCKYHNCLHINEPGCDIIEAVNKGDIELSRYESYLSMVIDEDNRR